MRGPYSNMLLGLCGSSRYHVLSSFLTMLICMLNHKILNYKLTIAASFMPRYFGSEFRRNSKQIFWMPHEIIVIR